jgi:hypothetical protein
MMDHTRRTTVMELPPLPGDTAAERAGLVLLVAFGMITSFIQRRFAMLTCYLIGSALLCEVYQTPDPFLLATLLFCIGTPLAILLSGGNRWIVRAFTLSFSVYVLVCGLSQFYTLTMWGQPISAGDSYGFFQHIKTAPPYHTVDSLYHLINAPYSIIIWQQVYRFCAAIGLAHDFYIGTLFNCFVMAAVSTLTVRIGKELFGRDSKRLRLIGTISAFCGIYWMFGTMLLRDGHITLVNTVVFLLLIRALKQPGLGRIVCAISGLIGAIYLMEHLRSYTVPILICFGFLSLAAWLIDFRLGSKKIWFAALAVICLSLFLPDIRSFVTQTYYTISQLSMRYMQNSLAGAAQNSLAANLVISQPLPIRITLAAFILLVNPIPLWMAFETWPWREFHVFKTTQGIMTVLILPSAVLGGFEIIRRNLRGYQGIASLNFLLAAFLLSLLGVALTSMESRHFAQFLPLLILLAAIPDTTQPKVNRMLAFVRVYWFFILVVLHSAWAFLRFL